MCLHLQTTGRSQTTIFLQRSHDCCLRPDVGRANGGGGIHQCHMLHLHTTSPCPFHRGFAHAASTRQCVSHLASLPASRSLCIDIGSVSKQPRQPLLRLRGAQVMAGCMMHLVPGHSVALYESTMYEVPRYCQLEG